MTIVDDSGLEVLRKSAIVVSQNEYKLRTDAAISGTVEATPSGLRIALLTTTMNITNVAAKVPAIPLTNRNSISVFNKSQTETIFVGSNNTVTANSVIGVTSGWEIPPLGTLNFDITEDVELWAISTSTVMVKVLELA